MEVRFFPGALGGDGETGRRTVLRRPHRKVWRFKSSSPHIGRLAQLVRASRLHREGRGFESLSDHMGVEEKYNQPTFNYYFSVVVRKITGIVFSYPEFMFLAKIIAILLFAVLVFVLFKGFFKV